MLVVVLLVLGGGGGGAYWWFTREPQQEQKPGTGGEKQGDSPPGKEPIPGAPIKSVAVSPDGKMLLIGSENATATLFDTSSGKILQTFKGHTDMLYGVVAVTLSRDGKYAYTAAWDKTAIQWDVKTAQTLHLHP